MTVYNVKGVACSDDHTDNYHLTLKFPSALWSNSASFSSALIYSPEL